MGAGDSSLLGGGVPPGIILAFGGSTAPDGWLLCDGSSVLRLTWPNLFGAIGTAFGSADGTHFNVPDLRGRHVLGVDGTHAQASTGGSIDHTHTGPAGHSNHVVTQPAAHVFTQPGAHSAHVVTQPSAHVLGTIAATPTAAGGATGSVSAAQAHTHAAPTITNNHAGAGVDAHSAHSGAGVDAHSASAVDAHSAHGATGSNNPPYLALNHIIKG